MGTLYYFLSLEKQYGYDSVLTVDSFASLKRLVSGDLIKDISGLYLFLGDEIMFPELYNLPKKHYVFVQPSILSRGFFSSNTMEIIHWMVHSFFSAYKKVIDLYIPSTLSLEKKILQLQKEMKSHKSLSAKSVSSQRNTAAGDSIPSQRCFLFPDLRTLSQYYFSSPQNREIVVSHGGMTPVQRRNIAQGVKAGTIRDIYGTQKALFFDWSNLTEILLHNPHNRGYTIQSDPRYTIERVVEEHAKVHNATIKTIE